jgi:hypothetical protein
VYKGPFGREREPMDQLRYAAASKLNRFHTHSAGGGSFYVTIDDFKLRFSNHANTSSMHEEPDLNIVDRELTDQDVARVIEQIKYPDVVKITALAMHVGLTVPKLKKLLTDSCYTEVCENPEYPNTFTRYVYTAKALNLVTKHGITERIPIKQESASEEDHAGA